MCNSCFSIWGDYSSTYHQAIARKEYECEICHKPIFKGEKYNYNNQSQVRWNKKWAYHPDCLKCLAKEVKNGQ